MASTMAIHLYVILLKPIVASKVINSDPNYHAGGVPDFQLILEIPSVIFDLTTNKVLECPVLYLSSYFS